MNNSKATSCPILYDAHELLIINKPEGVLSHPNPTKLTPGVGKGRRAAFEGEYDLNERVFKTPEGPIWLIHRLDQDTSGALMAARTKSMAHKCRELFEGDLIKKIYTALVSGKVVPQKGDWKDTILIHKAKNKIRSRAVATGKPNARLRYEVKNFFSQQRLTLLKIELLTGKTHQIRVQSAFHRYPVIGDEIYGIFSLNKQFRKDLGLDRLFLHASSLEFQHPVTKEHLKIEAPLPEVLQTVLQRLGASK